MSNKCPKWVQYMFNKSPTYTQFMSVYVMITMNIKLLQLPNLVVKFRYIQGDISMRSHKNLELCKCSSRNLNAVNVFEFSVEVISLA